MSEEEEPVVALFSPFALIWQHALPAWMIASAVATTRRSVDLIGCDGALNKSCVVFRTRNVNPQTQPHRVSSICAKCQAVSAEREPVRGMRFNIGDLVSRDSDQALEAFCSAISTGHVSDALFHELPIAKFALYNHTINHLSASTEVRPEQLDAFRAEVRSVGRAVLAGREYAIRRSPEAIIVSDLLYGTNRGFVAGARSVYPEIRAIGIYDSPNQAIPFTIFQWTEDVASTPFASAKAAWTPTDDARATTAGIEAVARYLESSITGRRFRSFSTPAQQDAKSVRRDVLGVSEGATIALVALSSEDEALAARASGGVSYRPQPYATQLEWLHDLASIVKDIPDVHLVVRPHPRFWNSPSNSQRAALEEFSRDMPEQMHLLTPEEYPSLYGLINEADAVLTSWTTVGIEARLMGLPALAYGSQLQGAPGSVLPAPETREAYLEAAEGLLRHPRWDIAIATEMFRWLDFAWHRNTLDFGSVLPARFNHQTRASSHGIHATADLFAYRFLPKRMARRDIIATRNTDAINTDITQLIDGGPIEFARLQLATTQTADQEQCAIRDVLSEIGTLLPAVASGSRPTLRDRLTALRF